MARAWTASKPASRPQALTRFRARGAWLYATLRSRAGRQLPNELRAEKMGPLAEALPLGVRDARFVWREMRSLGIEARLFHPFWSHLRGLLIRDHRKIVAIDRRISFTGGMNVANEYGSSRHNQGATWRDTHVRVEGPTAWDFQYQPAILHAKTLVVDDYVSVVGSSNLDFRSFYSNAECNVLIFDDATGRTMAQTFQEDLGRSIEMRHLKHGTNDRWRIVWAMPWPGFSARCFELRREDKGRTSDAQRAGAGVDLVED